MIRGKSRRWEDTGKFLSICSVSGFLALVYSSHLAALLFCEFKREIFAFLLPLSPPVWSLSPVFVYMTNSMATKRARDEEDSDPVQSDGSDSDALQMFSNDDDPQDKVRKKIKLEAFNKDMVRYTAMKKLRTAPKNSIGIPAIRALLAKSGSKHTAAARETNLGLQKTSQVATKAAVNSGSRKASNRKGKESVGLAVIFVST